MNSNKAYGDIEVYSPDNILMFRANEDKLKFYKKKGLIEQLGDKKYKLLFEPKGLGHGERNKELLSARDNKCVRCGDEDLLVLTRHHVVPSRFRKFFPDNLKSNNHRYVVFLCTDCHNEYGYYENELNDVLAHELGVKTLKQCNDEIYIEKRIITGIADTILFKDKVPQDRINILMEEFATRTGMPATEENLKRVRRKKYEPISEQNNFGKIIVDGIKNIYDFQQRWLEHFVYTMQPKYLPSDLIILLEKQ